MGAMLVRHEPTSASVVRSELARDLEDHGVNEEIIDDVTLVASELISNAVRHAGILERDELGVNWTIGRESVVVSVADPSDQVPVLQHVPPDSPNGRGLAIVDALTSEWGVERTRCGKRVWAKIAAAR